MLQPLKNMLHLESIDLDFRQTGCMDCFELPRKLAVLFVDDHEGAFDDTRERNGGSKLITAATLAERELNRG